MATPTADMPVPELIHFGPGDEVPNNPALPVVLLRGAVPEGTDADAICTTMEANGWGGIWVWSVFDYHHYHPDAHEALCVATGAADLQLGGPQGQGVSIAAGDLVVLPAGTGHKRLAASANFAVCGAYPPGQSRFKTHRARADAAKDTAAVAAVPLPRTDPIFGADGPLVRAWRA